MEGRLLTVAQAAEKLQVSKWLLYRAVETGVLPCYRINRLVRLSLADLDNWLQSMAHTGPSV